MELIRHSIQWIRGEILEMTLVAIAGFSIAAIGLAFHRFGGTPLAKAMVAPLVGLGLFFGALGVSGYVTNQRRIPAFQQAHRADPVAFVEAENKRVEGFQYMYVITNVLAPLCFAGATAIFWLTVNPHARAGAAALVLFGLFGFLVDGFSKERADIYYARIIEAAGGPT